MRERVAGSYRNAAAVRAPGDEQGPSPEQTRDAAFRSPATRRRHDLLKPRSRRHEQSPVTSAADHRLPTRGKPSVSLPRPQLTKKQSRGGALCKTEAARTRNLQNSPPNQLASAKEPPPRLRGWSNSQTVRHVGQIRRRSVRGDLRC